MTGTTDVTSLLGERADDWQAVRAALAERDADGDFCRALDRLAAASDYALRQLRLDPAALDELLALDEFTLDDPIIEPGPDDRIDLDQLRRELRRYRHRKHLAIIYLDVVRGHPLDEILAHLSDLADHLILVALDACNKALAAKHGQPRNERGEPMQLNIIAMGKLGGRELNFSSDVDLICCYEGDGELDGYGRLSYQEYFSRLVRSLVQVLADNTEDGFVYRVDLRLRPWGDSGPVVLSHAALEHYYQLHGREWEQYAMVKARVISGSDAERADLRAILQPFVYRRYHDYRVFEGLASMKDKIDAQARTRGMRDNIKLGPGGIREIEFCVQAFQILRGGRIRKLRSSRIFDCFEALAAQSIVERGQVAALRDAYVFLRRLENRIQMFADEQTHELPADPARRRRIAATLDFADWEALAGTLREHRDAVSRFFTELFKRESEQSPATILDDTLDAPGDARREEFVAQSGVDDPAAITAQLNDFIASKAWGFMSARAKKRFNSLLPDLLARIQFSTDQASLFERFMRLFAAIAGRSVYFELLVQNPALLQRLAELFDKSAWIATEVASYPMLLENLIQRPDRGRFDRAELEARLLQQLANVEGDPELELDNLRLFKREQTLVIAGAELAGEIDAVEVGRYLSDLAEIVLAAVLELARKDLGKRHGIPRQRLDGEQREAEFSIIGYGKLGGRELHYSSDLDLIFLHDSTGDEAHTDGDKCIENSVYFPRLAQKVISMTSVLTASGKLYEIDSRLRPEGSSGLLVSSLEAFERYQREKAWTWEHQALVRARPVAGDAALAARFAEVRLQILGQPREAAKLRADVVEMRARIYRNKRPPEDARRDLKHSRGGMVDLEFLVQYWVLLHANSLDNDCLSSDNISLLDALLRFNLIPASAAELVDIYRNYHRLLHQAVLQDQAAEVDAGVIAAQLERVTNCWNACFGEQEN